MDAPLIAAQVQALWDVPHAVWFTLMGVGGGIFLVPRLMDLELRLGLWLGLPVVDLISFVVIGVGGVILIRHLGRPFRFPRAVLKPGTSWISRGAIADFIFVGVAGLLILPGFTWRGARPLAWLPWDPAGADLAGKLGEVVALLCAAVVIYYAGQVLADATGIPYWHSLAVPIQFVLSSLASSTAVTMVLETLNGVPIGAGQDAFLAGVLALLLVAIVWHLRAETTAPGKAESLAALLRGRFRRAFLGGVVGAGTVLPLCLALLALAVPRARDAVGVLALLGTLPAGYALRLLTLRVGIYPPLHATIGVPRR